MAAHVLEAEEEGVVVAASHHGRAIDRALECAAEWLRCHLAHGVVPVDALRPGLLGSRSGNSKPGETVSGVGDGMSEHPHYER